MTRPVLVAVVAASLAVPATLLVSRPARAYVRFMNGQKPLYWKASCVPVTIYTNGFENASGGLSLNEIAKSIAAAAHTWSADAVSCSPDGTTHPDLEIVPTIVPGNGDTRAVFNDARNTIVVDRDTWGDSNAGYSTNGLALTHDSASPDGHIVDADIQINAVDDQWANLDPDSGAVPAGNTHVDDDIYDLQNTMTHEFGHFIGLAHSCFRGVPGTNVDAAGNPRPVDDKGQPVPDCDGPGVTDTALLSVMYDEVSYRETSKRTLSAEDVRAVCEMYPPGSATEPCTLDQPVVGCAVGPDGGRWRGARDAWPLGLAVAAALRLARVRRPRARLTGAARARS